jgi:histidinol phosphatase-like enzyme (inositol monophosphatase family)
MNDIQTLMAFAERLADSSRQIIRDAANKPFDLEIKPDFSPVTTVDKAVEDKLRELISDQYPDHGVLGEERADTNPEAEFKWVIDPIDGTLPFLAGLPVFGTLIALVRDEDPVIGIIDMPMTQERWVGSVGSPTTRNGAIVRTRACDSLSNAMMTTANPDFWTVKDQPALARFNSAARWGVYGGSCLAYAQIASGRIDVGIEVDFNIHDYLALVPVIQGAGGVITDWDGAKLTIRSGDRFVAAGDQRTHAATLKILSDS